MTPEEMWNLLDELADDDVLDLRDRAWVLWRTNQAHQETRQQVLTWLAEIEPRVINDDALGIIQGVRERLRA
jgi:hypothetical protein